MRIALYTRVFPPAVGGMERFAADLAGWLVAAGHEVVVLTNESDNRAATKRAHPVVRNPTIPAALRVLRSADVAHVNGLSLRGIGLSRAARAPSVVTHAGHQAVCPTGLAWAADSRCTAGPRPGPCAACPARGTIGWAKVRAHWAGAAVAERNVTISQYLSRRLDLRDADVVYNPVSEHAFAGADAAPGVDGLVAFAGRMVAEKGVDLLLRAVERVPEARLEVAGDGPLRPALKRLAHDLGIEGRVRFLGSVAFRAVADLYARAAAVCVPSRWDEPFGYAAAEAMAMGRPVVATPRGALIELLAGGRGFVAEDATPAGLAQALQHALDDASARAEAARCAQAFARQHLHIDVTARQYEDIYRRAVA